jgi:hypothetical protein
LLNGQTGGTGAPLQIRDVGHVQIRRLGQLILCPASLLPQLTDRRPQSPAQVVRHSVDGRDSKPPGLLH